MEIKVLKTNEISDALWHQIVEGFNEAFESSICEDDLKFGFCTQNKLGYGYHAVALSDEGELMGFNTFSPGFYKDELNTVFSGSVFVRKKFRTNEFLLMDMTNALRKKAIEEGYAVELGAPNHNAEKFFSKILKCIHITDLDYYLLPVHPSKCLNKAKIKFLDPIFSCFCRIHIFIVGALSALFNKKEQSVKYELETGNGFWKYRFPERQYKKFNSGKYHAYYRLYNENGAITAYLMDFRENDERTSRSLNKAISFILANDNVDAVLFVGLLNIKQCSLFKVPKRFFPKRIPFTYHILDKSKKDKYSDMKEKKNWSFSLMNFDVR